MLGKIKSKAETLAMKALNKKEAFKKAVGGKEVIMEVLLIVVGVAVAIIWKAALADDGGVIPSLVTSFQTKISGIFGS